MTGTHPSTASDPHPTAADFRGRHRGFALLLLVSGFCGISYEILYARILGNFIGDQFAVSASILLTFMLGIGTGTFYAHRLWRHLWLVEAMIGLYGAAFALGAGFVENGYYGMTWLSRGLDGAMVVCFGLVCVPAFLIGCSLPLFAGYLGRLTEGRVFSRAYTIYNFGAALTVLAVEFGLLRVFGILKTVLLMALLNIGVAVILRLRHRELAANPEAGTAPLEIPRRHLAALALASVASAVFQLLMVKLAESLLGPFRETFAMVLALVLLGIAVGSWLTRRLRLRFGAALLGALVGLVWLLGGFSLVADAQAALYPDAVKSYAGILLLKVGVVAALMGVPAICFGATIPALLGELGPVARDSGRLLCVSSLANAAGFLLMTLLLHPHFDYGVLVLMVAGLTLTGALTFAWGRWKFSGAALAIAGLAVALHFTRWNENLLFLGYDSFHSKAELAQMKSRFQSAARFKGAHDVFCLTRHDGDEYFIINGYLSVRLGSPAEKIVGAFPALFAPRTDRALVLGVGSGSSAGAAAALFQHTDAVEINPVVLENLDLMARHNFGLLHRTNAHLIVDDGIHFTRAGASLYSLIINTVTTPRYFSSSKLYTLEFLQSVRRRMTADGVYVTWMDVRMGDRGLNMTLKTAREVFPHCALAGVRTGYFLLLCSPEPIRLRHPRLVADNAELSDYFYRQNAMRGDLLPYGLLLTNAYSLIIEDGRRINTMDFPALEFEMARADDSVEGSFPERVAEAMRIDDVRAAVEPAAMLNPVDLILYSELLFYDSDFTLQRSHQLAEEDEDFTGKLNAGRIDYFRAHAAASGTADAQQALAEVLLRQRQYAAALRESARALELDPRHSEARLTIGAAHEKLGDYPAAVREYEAILKVSPRADRALFGLGRVLYRQKNYEAALEQLRRSNALVERPEVYFYLGLTLEEAGRKAEAEQAFTAGRTMDIKPAAIQDARDRRLAPARPAP